LDCKVKVCPACKEALATHFDVPFHGDAQKAYQQEEANEYAQQTWQEEYQRAYEAAYPEDAPQAYHKGEYQDDCEEGEIQEPEPQEPAQQDLQPPTFEEITRVFKSWTDGFCG
jgi:hypothetical protein